MIKKHYKNGAELREAIADVATYVGNTIGNTLGPAGRNYFIPTGITNDGASIIREIEFHTKRNTDDPTDGYADEVKNSIKGAFEEVAERQDRDAGDGTTTATVVATKLTLDVLPLIPDIDTPIPGTKSVMDISRQLDEEKDKAIELLEKQVKPVKTFAELKLVASTAMEGHSAHEIVAETIWEAGAKSNTVIEEGHNGAVEKDVVPGIQMPMKIETPAMYTNVARKEAVWDDAVVLVANHVFEHYASDLARFMSTMIQYKTQTKDKAQPVVIVGKHFSIPFVAQVTAVSRQTRLPILLLSAALFDEEFQDIATYVGANYIDTTPKEGRKMSDVTFADAGHVKKIIAGKEQTAFIGGRGLEVDGESSPVQRRAAELRKLAEREKSPKVRELLEKRANGLNGGIATLYVDAKTAVDRYYLKLKIEDAMNSCKAALDGGMVEGGGLALKKVGEQMKGAILADALKEPYYRIIKNAGGELEIPKTIKNSYYADKGAIENAVAVVKILITTEGVISDVEADLVDQMKTKLLK